MTNYKTTHGSVPLGEYICASAEISHTFTGLSIDLLNTYSQLHIVIDGKPLTAAADLEISFNGITGTSYNRETILNDADTISGTNEGSAAHVEVMGTEILLQDSNFSAHAILTYKGFIANGFNLQCIAGCGDGGQSITFGNMALAGAGSTITTILISLSGNTWDAGTQIEIYGILR